LLWLQRDLVLLSLNKMSLTSQIFTMNFVSNVIFNNFSFLNHCRVNLLLMSLLLTSCSTFNVTDLVDIVLAVKLHFRSGCVCVAHDHADGKSSKSVALLCNIHLILEFTLFHIWAYMLGSFPNEGIFPTPEN